MAKIMNNSLVLRARWEPKEEKWHGPMEYFQGYQWQLLLEYERAKRTENKSMFGVYVHCCRADEDDKGWKIEASVRTRLISPYGSPEKRPDADVLFYDKDVGTWAEVETIHKGGMSTCQFSSSGKLFWGYHVCDWDTLLKYRKDGQVYIQLEIEILNDDTVYGMNEMFTSTSSAIYPSQYDRIRPIQLQEHHKTIVKLNEKISQLTDANKDLAEKNEALEKTNVELQVSIEEANEKLEKASTENSELKKKIEQLGAKTSKRNQVLLQQMVSAEYEKARLQASLDEKSNIIKELEEKLKEQADSELKLEDFKKSVEIIEKQFEEKYEDSIASMKSEFEIRFQKEEKLSKEVDYYQSLWKAECTDHVRANIRATEAETALRKVTEELTKAHIELSQSKMELAQFKFDGFSIRDSMASPIFEDLNQGTSPKSVDSARSNTGSFKVKKNSTSSKAIGEADLENEGFFEDEYGSLNQSGSPCEYDF